MKEMDEIFSRFGRQLHLCLPDGWRTAQFGAFLQPLRYKNKMYLGGVNTRIGFNREGYFLYLGPPEHDLTQLGREMWIQCGQEKYTVDRAEKVYCGDAPSHIWAIVRSMVGEENA
ncbi:MAG: hypothetical protein LBQ33_03775 [Oscillospiraceae bacterium]|jgi:hypothetical protein|nr:hypothetical protein [Oscillospiraceae bacterium]